MDVAQSVALHAMQKLEELEFRDADSLRNWVLTLAERKMIDWMRRGYVDPVRRGGDGLSVDASDLVFRVDSSRRPSSGPSTKVTATEELERLREARLPEELREPLRLNRLEGRSYQEVADRLGLTYKQARRLVGLGQLELSRMLRDREES